MVITYTIEELHNIGNIMALKRTLNHPNNNDIMVKNAQDFEENLVHFQKQLQMLGHPIQVVQWPPAINNKQVADTTTHDDGQQLSSSVAEFFKKAKQNFHFGSDIDPTKVRRLSDVEAELLGNKRES